MSVYTIAQLKFTDEVAYRRYQAAFPAVFARFDAAVVVADDAPERVEGDRPFDKIVILRFPDAAEARRFAEDESYLAISRDRKVGASCVVLNVRGLD